MFGEEFVDQNTVCTSLINANSPMVWDETMLGALKVYARNNQAVIITPFILVGRHDARHGGGHADADPGRGALRHGDGAAGAAAARR